MPGLIMIHALPHGDFDPATPRIQPADGVTFLVLDDGLALKLHLHALLPACRTSLISSNAKGTPACRSAAKQKFSAKAQKN